MRRVVSLGLIATMLAVASLALAQQRLPERPRALPQPRVHRGIESYYDRQLAQVDQLIRLEHLSRANAMLEQLADGGAPPADVRKRRIRIALAVGENARARDLCREALGENPDDVETWRRLAAAEVALGDPDAARAAVDRYLGLIDDPRQGFAAAIDVLAGGQHPAATVAVIDSARTVLRDPAAFARRRAVGLLQLERPVEAAREARADLVASPYNLPFLRRDLLGDDAPVVPRAFDRALLELAGEPRAVPELAILAANVLITRGEPQRALDLVTPHLGRLAAARAALTNAGILAIELPMLAEGPERAAQVAYLLELLPRAAAQPQLNVRRKQAALESLATACQFALANDLLDRDPATAAARFGELLELVREGHPESPALYTAQIELARFTRDRLGEPLAAASRLETLLMDLDLPLEGVALARLALGESYLAARDTARARSVLTALGRDTEFRAPAGHAHFLLAKLDLAQGHIGTARDRFAATALDNPSAPYANDALTLGLIIAEELQNPTGGPDLLQRYARSTWWELVAEPDSQRVALRRYLERAEVQVDLAEPQPLLEHARVELAVLERDAGRLDHALALLERVVTDQPDGRLAPRALALRGEILADQRLDTAAARREYERLLAQYPDYLFVGEIRERLRELP